MKRSVPLAIALVVLGLLFGAAAIFYFTVKTNFILGGRPAIHTHHAEALVVLAVLCLIAANFARPKRLGA